MHPSMHPCMHASTHVSMHPLMHSYTHPYIMHVSMHAPMHTSMHPNIAKTCPNMVRTLSKHGQSTEGGIFDATVYRGGLQTKFISSLDIAYIKFRPKNDQTEAQHQFLIIFCIFSSTFKKPADPKPRTLHPCMDACMDACMGACTDARMDASMHGWTGGPIFSQLAPTLS